MDGNGNIAIETAAGVAAIVRQAAPVDSPPDRPADRSVAIDYLRAFITVLVVIHHSLLAYQGGIPGPGRQFAGGAMLWRAFPVMDSQHWPLASLVTGFNDIFFMSLMFLLSGLFVWPSLQRKGAAGFVRDRALRLGVPFLFSAGLITPLAYYAAYLQAGGAPGLAGYAQAWGQIGYWPTGPAWFVSLLLAFDIAAAALYLMAPRWGEWVGRLGARAAERPAGSFWRVVAISAAAYAVLDIPFGAMGWTYWGLFQFQTARPLLYGVYFALGVGLGAYGLDRGLLAAGGRLARRWPLWAAAMTGAFLVGAALFFLILAAKGPARSLLVDAGAVTFALSCAASCFGCLALAVRFAQARNRVFDSLARNAYGIYLVHYAFVAGLQYALLGLPWPGGAKAGRGRAAVRPARPAVAGRGQGGHGGRRRPGAKLADHRRAAPAARRRPHRLGGSA
jgi:peptidoglycan/LPS O-acetylase OafA/YrhL